MVVVASYENQVQSCRDGEGRKTKGFPVLTRSAPIDNKSTIADQSNILEGLSDELPPRRQICFPL